MKQAILLINLGSPDSPHVGDVRRYLREFLMDKRVLDVAWPIRAFVVYGCILPFRPKQSAEAYEKIWTLDGSPLVVSGKKVRAELEQRLNRRVELAMRYQNPSVRSAVERLVREGIDEIRLIPMFPHYAMSSYETAVERVQEVLCRIGPHVKLSVLPPYYDRPEYIRALAASAADYLQNGYDHLLFSYHGIPERQVKKADPTGCHCLTAPSCCETESPAHATCYRAQCFKTTQAFLNEARVPAAKCSVSFQSRLGRDPWLKPYTDHVLAELPKRGVRKVLVICPAFVADCLETIEEIGMRGRETFLEAGGQEFALIPCMNEQPLWLDALEAFSRERSSA